MKKMPFLIVMFSFLVLSCEKKEIKPIDLKLFNYKVEYAKQVREVVESFTAKYKGKYSIEIETIPYEAQLVLEARLREKTGWDIIMIPPYSSIEKNASGGYLLDLSSQPFMQKIYDSVKPPVTYDGKVYAMPYGLSAYGVFYNKDIFAANQLSVPKNIGEMKDIINRLQSNKIVPFSICGKDEWTSGYLFFSLISSSMGKEVDRWIESMNEGVSSFNNPKNDRVFEILDFYRANGGSNIKSIDYYVQMKNFASGSTAMLVQGFNEYNVMVDQNSKINAGIFAFPIGEANSSDLCVDVDFAFAISSNIDKEKTEGAIRFLDFLTNYETMELMSKGARIIFGVKDFASSGVTGDIKKYLDEGKIVNWAHRKIPAGVFEESKSRIKKYLTGETTKEEVSKNLDRVWRINIENR
ncbi:MAG TPA: extracellular solute-binding protein [Spirochaetota bacterium]|jgi:raffinose/stachyose/melibiose transport system substrate-binding protein|nr:MAG: Multiple sugar-binding protein precursor [Spirochaetes bacterium ADurb.Bin133]HNZ27856.1 extracellular solute-binding protein [Spirochaetota bacterium]HPY88603.1 extracellular solute-binding protein [Spirochaetota bacterium]HQB60904.1 extracellular solute-binding protein [Spirochaetota bacterium]